MIVLKRMLVSFILNWSLLVRTITQCHIHGILILGVLLYVSSVFAACDKLPSVFGSLYMVLFTKYQNSNPERCVIWACILCLVPRNKLLFSQSGLRPIKEDSHWQWSIPSGGYGPHQWIGCGRGGAVPIRALWRRLHHHPQDPERMPGRNNLLPEGLV